MSIFVKVFLLPSGIFSAAFLAMAMDHLWRDRRTKKYSRTRNAFVGVSLLLAVLSGFAMYREIKEGDELRRSVRAIEEQQSAEVARATQRSEAAVKESDELREALRAVQEQQSAEVARADQRFEAAVAERDHHMRELAGLRVDLEPLVSIAHERYPGLERGIAVARLAADLERLGERVEAGEKEVRALKDREDFKPLSQTLRVLIVENLTSLSSSYPGRKITVSIEAGSVQRGEVAAELMGLFDKAGIEAEGIGVYTHFGIGQPDVVFALKNPTDVDLEFAGMLAWALSPFLKTKPAVSPKAKLPSEEFSLTIYGRPWFGPDGAVTFRNE